MVTFLTYTVCLNYYSPFLTVHKCGAIIAPLHSIIIYNAVLGLDNRNIDNRYRYSTFSNNRYRDQMLICTYVHAH